MKAPFSMHPLIQFHSHTRKSWVSNKSIERLAIAYETRNKDTPFVL